MNSELVAEEIKKRVGVLDLAAAQGWKLKKASRNVFETNCPFHPEERPSFKLYASTNSFCCYGCGVKGDVIALYARINGLTNKEAFKELAKQFNLNKLLAKPGSQKNYTPKPTAKGRLKPHYSEIFEALKSFCGELDPESLGYLKGRGLSEETIKHFQIFSIKDYRKVKLFLVSHFLIKDLKESGLIWPRGRFAFTKNRLIIPVIKGGKIVALRGRFFDSGLTNPSQLKAPTFTYLKYVSTVGIGGRFFNSDVLKGGRLGDKLFLCEGEFDTMILHQKGVKAVGLFGASNCNRNMLSSLKPFNLIICLDNDEVGKNAAKKIWLIFSELTGRKPDVLELKPGVKDITEFYLKKGRQIA